MIVILLVLALAITLSYIASLLGQLHRVQNKYGLKLAGLEQELHEALEAVGHYHSPISSPYMSPVSTSPVADPNSAAGIALAAMIARKEQQLVDAMAVPKHLWGHAEDIVIPNEAYYDPGEEGEHASCLAYADPSKNSGFIIVDDPHLEAVNVELVHDDELTERLRSSIARRAGEDTPIIHIIARVHGEDKP